MDCFQTKLMSLKDERMKVMNEALSGIKVSIQMLSIFVVLTADFVIIIIIIITRTILMVLSS